MGPKALKCQDQGIMDAKVEETPGVCRKQMLRYQLKKGCWVKKDARVMFWEDARWLQLGSSRLTKGCCAAVG